MTRCTGHCCRDFPLSYGALDCLTAPPGGPVGQDASFILDMLRWKRWDDYGGRFTCRHLLPSGDCGAYESRPRMCSQYPYGDACRVSGCTMVPSGTA